MSKAIDDVLAERVRQVEVEEWTTEHDDLHKEGDLAMAGACYAAHAAVATNTPSYSIAQSFIRRYWPWGLEWWKPKDKRRDLVRATALLIAEIERLDRATGLPASEPATPTMIHTPQQCKAAFEWLREQATKADAEPLAGVALDEWHALATAGLVGSKSGKSIGELERNYQEAREECTALRMGWDECIREKNKQGLSIIAPIAAIRYALQTDGEGLTFLRCWMHGEFPAIRAAWPDAPEAVFIGADPLHPETQI